MKAQQSLLDLYGLVVECLFSLGTELFMKWMGGQ